MPVIRLGKVFGTQDTFGRGEWNSMGNLETQAILQNIKEIPITQVYSNSDPECTYYCKLAL